MMTSGYNIAEIVQEAQTRWLKPAEVLFILQNYENHYQITNEPPQKPPSGSLFLFNKRVLRFFRKDGHNWRRKKDGRTVGEAHERLKVGNVEALNCYYAHGEQNPDFQRRCYWILDPAYDHIVLVHYRDISLGRSNAGSVSTVSPTSSSIFIQSPNSCTTQLPQSAVVGSEIFEPYEYSSTPNSTEVSSDMLTKGDGTSHMGMMAGAEETDCSPNLEIDQALKRLEVQLSLDDENLNDIGPLYTENGYYSNEPEYMVNKQNYNEYGEIDAPNTYISQVCSGENGEQHHQQQFENEFSITGNDTYSWEFEVLEFNGGSAGSVPQQNSMYTSDINGVVHPPSSRDSPEQQEKYLSSNVVANNDTPNILNQEADDLNFTPYSHARSMLGSNPGFYSTMFDQGQNGMPLQSELSLTTVQEQKFDIREISPEWGYAHEPTKVIIIGSFRCDPSNYAWSCMFGDIEVPLEIIQEGVFSCQAPPGLPGKVSLLITSGNRESCSEVREFEYRVNPRSLVNTSSSHTELSRSSEELLLLVRCVQLLLSDPPKKKGESVIKPGVDPLGSLKPHEDSWDQVIEALLDGSWASFTTTDWLLQELLKDKLQQWLSSRLQEEEDIPALSKREQGIIHMVSGLGFGWALTPILGAGVNVDFRDVNGWTALHWAARFGREKMVAELLASGASAGAVTDPNPQDPVGKTPASIAATYGHKGLAGYLSELALTSHLSSLTIEESELSRSSADVEAQRTINSVSNTNLVINEDQLSMKDTLAAVRNAAQAAARIQSAFRAHSFRRRQEKEAAGYGSGDEYGILPSEIGELSAVSKLAFRSARDNNAALSIQKKYRGWKGRKDFLSLRQKVVKIQAHVRGYQVRKNYKVICWAVSVVEKVVLRWRRKGVGLRGFRQEADSVDTSEDEDVAKVFRKQKVDAALDEAVSRVLSMVESQEARQQYRRMLERYRQAKAERGGLGNSESGSASQSDIADMENDDLRWCA